MKPVATRPWSTPLIIGSSLVVTISGVMMFFHVGEQFVKSMHEWLGLIFVVAILLHVLNHWMPFSRYLRDRRALSVIAMVCFVALGWMLFTGANGQQHPAKRLVASMQQAPIALLAELQHQDSQQLLTSLRNAGVKVDNDQQSLNQLATTNQRTPFELLDMILPAATVTKQ